MQYAKGMKMGKEQKLWKRLLSIVLAVTLSLSSFTIPVSAEGTSNDTRAKDTTNEASVEGTTNIASAEVIAGEAREEGITGEPSENNPNAREQSYIVEAENAQLKEPGDFSDDNDTASHGGKHIRTQKIGASVTLTFTGTGIRFYTKKGSGAGVLQVEIDGGLHGKADEYVNGSPQFQSKTYEALNLSEDNAEHKIVLTTTSENPNDINGSPWFNFDYFEVIQSEGGGAGDIMQSPGDTNYYLDSQASQNGDGSQESPFNTLDEINRREFAPGDHIFIRRGSVFSGLLYPKGSGSEEKPILLEAYGEGEKPLIDGGGRYARQQEYGAEGPFGEDAAAVYLYNSQYWEISDLRVTNWDEDAANRERSGIRVEAGGGGVFRHIYIKNCEIFDVRGYRGQDSIWDVDPVGGGTTFFGSRTTHRTGGINFCSYTSRENNASDKTNPGTVTDNEPTIFEDILIEGNNIENCDANGITTTNVKGEMDNRDYRHKNVVIRSNSIKNVQRAGIVPLYTDGALVEHNKVDTFQQTTEGYGCGIWCDRANDMIFQYNEVCNGQNTMDGMAFNLDDMTENGVIQYNYTHNNVGGGTMLHVRTNSYNRNNTIRYNLSVNDTHHYAPHQAIIVCVGEDANTKIEAAKVYNNTFFNTRTVRPVYKGDEIAFQNNIFYMVNKGMKNKTDAYDVGYNTTFNKNLFAGVHPKDEPAGNGNLTAAMPGLSGVLVNKDGDQYLPKEMEEAIAAARLAHNSEALNAGVAIEDGAAVDLYGNPVIAGEAPNIGAYNGESVEKTEYEDFTDITEAPGEPSDIENYTIEFVEGEDERVSKSAAFKTNPSGAHGGFHISSDEDGAAAEYTFTGKAISVYTKSGAAAGVANIYLDGHRVATDDQYEGTETFGRMAFTRTFTESGTHTIKIERSGMKNPSSSGTNVNLDYFKVFKESQFVVPDRSFHVPPTWNQKDSHITLPEVAEGWKIELFGSDRKEVIGLDKSVTRPLEDVTVNLLYKLTNQATGEVLETNVNAQITITAAPMEDFASGSNGKPDVIPALREWKGASGQITLSNGSRIIVDAENYRENDAVHVKANLSKTDNFYNQVNMFKADLKAQTGLDLPIVTDQEAGIVTGQEPVGEDIYFTTQSAPESLGAEGYVIEFGGQNGDGNCVIVRAPHKTGILYGGITILQILKQNAALALPKGMIRDYPAYEKRGYMLDAARIYLPLEYLEDTLKQMAWYKMNTFSVHLNDCENWGNLALGQERYSAFRLESNVPGLTAEDGFYTKDEFREFQYDAVDLGINVIPEFDTPGHSLAFTRVWPELAREDNAKYLDVTKPQALEKVKALFDEYILPQGGEEEVFIGPEVNVGTDEYKTNGLPEADRTRYKEAFRGYIDQILKHVKNRGKEPAFWGCLRENAGTTPVTTDALMYAWYWDYSEALKALDAGYRVLTMDEMETYIVPGGGWYVNQYGRGEHLYNTWLPNDNRAWDVSFAGDRAPAPKGHPRVVGGQFAVWNDWIGNGISSGDISFRIQYNIPAIAQKSWSVDESNGSMSYAEFKQLGEIIGDAPGSDFLYRNNKFTEDKILDLGETGDIVHQANMELQPVNIDSSAQGKDGSGIRFNGKDSYMESNVASTGFDWTAGMWINPDEGNAADTVLMEGKTGTLKLKQGMTGKIGYTVGKYNHYFNYRLPEGRWSHIALTGDAYGVKLYVNGIFIDELKDKPWPNLNFDSNFAKPSGQPDFIPAYYQTLMLPTAVLGSKTNAFAGVADDIRIYNRVLGADEILEMANVSGDAQGALAAIVNEANTLLDSGRLSEDPEAKAAMLNAVKAAANALGNPDVTEEQIRSAAQALQAEVEKAPADPAAINLMTGAAAETQVECHPGFGPEKMLDGDDALESRLATKRGVEEVPIEISLTGEKTFNTLVIKEGLGPITGETLTAQIKGYEIQAFKDGVYESLLSARDEASGIVGEKLTIDLGQDVTASKVRVIFKVNPTAGINIKEAELYRLAKPQPYVNETARDVVSYLGIPERLELTDTHLPVSEMPGAYSPRIIASSNPDIIALDGTVAREDADQTVTVLMEVTKRKGTNTILEKAVMPYTVVVAGIKIPAVTCQVTFHGNGGAVPNPASKEVLAGEAIGNLPETTREGYEFLGWFTAQTGGTKVTEETVVNSSMDLYARWREITVQQPQQPQKPQQPHPEVSFAKKEYSLYATQTVKTSVNANVAAGAVTGYQSSNTRVAVVTSGGVIKGIKKGTATITVSTSGKGTASVKVTVKTPKVTLTVKNAKLQEGKTTKAITVSRKIKTDKIVKFTSSKKKIASVNRKGRIKGIKAGKTKITVFMKSGAKASCILTVQKAPVKTTKIRVPKKIILKVNKKQKIDVVRKPVTSADKIDFRSSNSKIAKVGKKGVITAKKAGSCNINVTCNKISKKIRVIVERK